jgi:hypothetical protein
MAHQDFTDEEVVELRALLEKEKRVVWFWSTMRVWAAWVAGVVGGYFALKSFYADVFGGTPK